MHILSPRNRSEFLAVPQLVRFSMPKGSDGPEATILLKASSLCLKYLVRRSEFEILVVRLSDDCIGMGWLLRMEMHILRSYGQLQKAMKKFLP